MTPAKLRSDDQQVRLLLRRQAGLVEHPAPVLGKPEIEVGVLGNHDVAGEASRVPELRLEHGPQSEAPRLGERPAQTFIVLVCPVKADGQIERRPCKGIGNDGDRVRSEVVHPGELRAADLRSIPFLAHLVGEGDAAQKRKLPRRLGREARGRLDEQDCGQQGKPARSGARHSGEVYRGWGPWYSVSRKKDREARLRAMKSSSFTTPQGNMP